MYQAIVSPQEDQFMAVRPARTPAPASLVLIDDVEAAATANTGRCNDDNPYR
jgi:hypothetical protein